MLRDLLFLLVGSVGLYFGADWFVRGAAGIARSFGVSALVVGLTVVSFGTSAPELAVSCAAAIDGRSAIALGNVVGSNIANIGIILGITTLIAPPRVHRGLILLELPVLAVATAALPLALVDGRIGRLEAALFVAGAVAFSLFLFWQSRKGAEEQTIEDAAEVIEEVEERLDGPVETSPAGRLRLAAVLVAGLAVLLVGGKLFVDGAVAIALVVGMSERVVGLTVVAIGTSLPELAASLVAALRGHSDIAVGNVVGSNIFNLLLILGAAGLISPIEGALSVYAVDLVVVGALTLLSVAFLRTERVIHRWEGVLLTAVYAGYMVWLVAAS